MGIKTRVVLYILAIAPNSIIILQDPREKLQVETLCAQKKWEMIAFGICKFISNAFPQESRYK